MDGVNLSELLNWHKNSWKDRNISDLNYEENVS